MMMQILLCYFSIQFLVRDWQNFEHDWEDEHSLEEQVALLGSIVLATLILLNYILIFALPIGSFIFSS